MLFDAALFERCGHERMTDVTNGSGIVAKQCAECLQVFPWRACDQCGRQTVMRAKDRQGWYCSRSCKRHSATVRAKGGAK